MIPQSFARYIKDVLGIESILTDKISPENQVLTVEGAGRVMFVGQGISHSSEKDLLHKMIVAMGLEPAKILLADGLLSDLKQISQYSVQILVLLGHHPMFSENFEKLQGQWKEINGIKLMTTYSPTELLANPDLKKQTWNDLKKVMFVLKEFAL